MTRTGSRSGTELRALVRARDGDLCWICGRLIDFALPPGSFMGPSLEHVIPVAAGGTSDLPNLRLAHARPCNSAKGAVHDGMDWAAYRDTGLVIYATERHQRQMAAALAKIKAVDKFGPKSYGPDQAGTASHPGKTRDRDRGMARKVRRAKTGIRAARGPWSGLIVVEERGPWGGIVVRNSGDSLQLEPPAGVQPANPERGPWGGIIDKRKPPRLSYAIGDVLDLSTLRSS